MLQCLEEHCNLLSPHSSTPYTCYTTHTLMHRIPLSTSLPPTLPVHTTPHAHMHTHVLYLHCLIPRPSHIHHLQSEILSNFCIASDGCAKPGTGVNIIMHVHAHNYDAPSLPPHKHTTGLLIQLEYNYTGAWLNMLDPSALELSGIWTPPELIPYVMQHTGYGIIATGCDGYSLSYT